MPLVCMERDDRDLVHALRDLRQKLGNLDSGDVRRDRLEGRGRLRVPGIELARATFSQSRMQDCALPSVWALAARKYCGKLIPRKPSDPTCRKARLEASRLLRFRQPVVSCYQPPLMIFREFAGTEHGPYEVLQRLVAILARRNELENCLSSCSGLYRV